MPAYSSNFKKVVNSVSTTQQTVIMLIINQAALEEPIYVVNDKANLVSNGITYVGLGFNITLPTDPQTGDPTATLSIDNVSQELMEWLEVSNGAPGTTVTIQSALLSNPDNIEWSMTLNLINISANNKSVSGTLAYNNLAQLSATNRTYSPQLAPGLY